MTTRSRNANPSTTWWRGEGCKETETNHTSQNYYCESKKCIET